MEVAADLLGERRKAVAFVRPDPENLIVKHARTCDAK
jgi:hypothetical protein